MKGKQSRKTIDKTAFKYQYRCTMPKCGNRFTSDKSTNVPICPQCSAKGRSMKSTYSEPKVKKIKEAPKLGYEITFFNADEKSIEQFEIPENRRQLSQGQVESLTGSLMRGQHFDSPIVVNKKGEKMRLIDGNHRIEAVSRMIRRNPGYRIEIAMVTYDDLDEDGEMAIFKRWNVGRPQSTDDYIQSISHKVQFLKWIKKDFPCDVVVYRQPGSMSVKLLAGAVLAAKREDETGYGIKKKTFQRDMSDLDEKDYKFAKKWMGEFIEIFGEPKYDNKYYRTTFFTAATFIRKEIGDYPQHAIKQLFEENVRGDEEVKQVLLFSGREANKTMINLLRKKMAIRK